MPNSKIFITFFSSLLLISFNNLSLARIPLTTQEVRQSPATYFDLSHWKLTIPTKTFSEITPKKLERGYNSKYFYLGSSNTMVFWCKPGNTTKYTHYSRSELRERLAPDSDEKNWSTSCGTHILSARLKVDAHTSAPKIVVLQVHAYKKNAYAPPLLKIIWIKKRGQLAAEYKISSQGDKQKNVILGAPGNNIFSCRIKIINGILLVYYNGQLKLKHTVDYWASYQNYFKAGNYLQTTEPDVTGEVIFYSLSHKHDTKKCKL